jgi:hypothetical protein
VTGPLLSLETRLVGGAVLAAFVGWVLYLVRYQRLSLRDSLLWLVSTGSALVLTIFPGLLGRAAAALGVAVPANALFGVAFVYVALNLLASTVALSGHAARIRRLAQECALLRAEIEALRADASK